MEFGQFSIDDMWFVPPLFAADDFIAGVFTVNNTIRFCLRYASADMDKEAVEKLIITAKDMLLCTGDIY
jgi:hypothetical protein